ncbi:MAG: sulfurtransferase [Leptolyngbyaceae cyanobacterium SL_7_1]|nr:sulfurtransferase [Leptolyngbyaceae cyanobacterium SL_7_1]
MAFTPFVSAQWLADHLYNPEVAIVDCRFSLANPTLGRQQYEATHIPGAYYFDLNQDLSSPVKQHGGRHPLPEPTLLASKLAAIGLDSANPTKRVIAYDDSRFAFAARFWWLVRYLGYGNVAILDGGFQGWVQAGYALTDEIPPTKTGHFIPNPHSEWVVDREIVQARKDLPSVVLVDSREAERYRGEHEPIDPIAGHIPGAVNYPWQTVTDEQGYSRSIADQQSRWETITGASEILVYCGSGVTACVNLLSLSLVGISTGRLYAGSWSDWCSYLNDQAST